MAPLRESSNALVFGDRMAGSIPWMRKRTIVVEEENRRSRSRPHHRRCRRAGVGRVCSGRFHPKRHRLGARSAGAWPQRPIAQQSDRGRRCNEAVSVSMFQAACAKRIDGKRKLPGSMSTLGYETKDELRVVSWQILTILTARIRGPRRKALLAIQAGKRNQC